MKGVKFDNYHSYQDFSLILSGKTIGSPSAKTEVIDLPGADGVLDVSEYFGEIKYNNRNLSLEFATVASPAQFPKLFSQIQNALHGQKMKIILDDDPAFYYVGRISIKEWQANKNIGQITVECDCEPYKYKLYKTCLRQEIVAGATLNLVNLRKRVVPKIITTAAITINFKDTVYSVGVGTYQDPAIILEAGSNLMEIIGNTDLIVEYQEGCL